MPKIYHYKGKRGHYIMFRDSFDRHNVSGLFPDGKVRTLVSQPGYKIVIGNEKTPYYISKIVMRVKVSG